MKKNNNFKIDPIWCGYLLKDGERLEGEHAIDVYDLLRVVYKAPVTEALQWVRHKSVRQ